MANYYGIKNLRVHIVDNERQANIFISGHNGEIVDIEYRNHGIMIIYIDDDYYSLDDWDD